MVPQRVRLFAVRFLLPALVTLLVVLVDVRRDEDLDKFMLERAWCDVEAIALTRLSAPARELNRVAVTTRRLSGSTAPTATSGVTTMLTSFGGAVKIVARPKRTGNDTGVEPRGDAGIPGVLARGLKGLIPLTLRRAFDIDP